MAIPIIVNKNPENNSKGIDGYSLISFDIYDTDDTLSELDVYIDGNLAFTWPNSFIAPYNGPESLITEITILGYHGYNITIDYTGIFDSATDVLVRATNSLIDESWSFMTGNEILFIEQLPYEITLGIEFKLPLVGDGVLSSANYIFNNNMYARHVEIESPTRVKLWVENFHTHTEFSLSLSSNVLDSYGNPIPNSYNSISFSPFQSTAHLSNFNGKIRTWRDSKLVSADTERVYLAGEKGIDVFNKILRTNTSRWGQVFGNPIESMFIANFGSSYKFKDYDPPYITNQDPAPDASVPCPSTQFGLSIMDQKTSVEPTSVVIYVNNSKAFDGTTGWLNGYSGNIIIKHKGLDVSIINAVPFTRGSVVVVRVVAVDLMGNALDTQYLYYVIRPVESGWGLSLFGLFSYGFGAQTC